MPRERPNPRWIAHDAVVDAATTWVLGLVDSDLAAELITVAETPRLADDIMSGAVVREAARRLSTPEDPTPPEEEPRDATLR